MSNVKVKLRNVRGSTLKIRLLADLIRGKSCDDAVNILKFSNKKISIALKKLLLSAIANAQNNYNLDIDSLCVGEIIVSKGMVMKRFRARAKGRGSRILKPFSHVVLSLSDKEKG